MKKFKAIRKKIGKPLRSRPKENLADNEAIFSSVGDHVMGLVVVDKAGKIIRVNQGFETLTEWKAAEVIGKPFVKIIPREDENGHQVPFRERILARALSGTILTNTATVAAGGIAKLPTFYYLRKDRSRFPASSVISPVLLKGKVAGAVEVFYDITKQKELERIRMDFLTLASHQLRTPLSGIKWLIETMNKGVIGPVPKRQKEYLTDIYRINERMIRLISDILSTLRLESEETLLKKETISVAALFKDVLITAVAAAQERRVTLKGPLNHRKLTIKTDPEILKAILGCFLSNAIEYSRSGQKVVLDVQVKPQTGVIVFSVRDSGIGIPKREQSRIFERFYRAANAKALKPSGTGLGLNIASQLAAKIGGEIYFRSQENKGTTFYLRIPKRSNPGVPERRRKRKVKKINKSKHV